MAVGAGGGLFVNESHLHQCEGAGGLHVHPHAADQQVPLDLPVGEESLLGLIGGFKGLDDGLQILRGPHVGQRPLRAGQLLLHPGQLPFHRGQLGGGGGLGLGRLVEQLQGVEQLPPLGGQILHPAAGGSLGGAGLLGLGKGFAVFHRLGRPVRFVRRGAQGERIQLAQGILPPHPKDGRAGQHQQRGSACAYQRVVKNKVRQRTCQPRGGEQQEPQRPGPAVPAPFFQRLPPGL